MFNSNYSGSFTSDTTHCHNIRLCHLALRGERNREQMKLLTESVSKVNAACCAMLHLSCHLFLYVYIVFAQCSRTALVKGFTWIAQWMLWARKKGRKKQREKKRTGIEGEKKFVCTEGMTHVILKLYLLNEMVTSGH